MIKFNGKELRTLWNKNVEKNSGGAQWAVLASIIYTRGKLNTPNMSLKGINRGQISFECGQAIFSIYLRPKIPISECFPYVKVLNISPFKSICSNYLPLNAK